LNSPKIKDYKKEWFIGEEIWTVHFVRTIPDPDTDLVGLCDPETQKIFIKLGQGRRDTLKTGIHEMLHAIAFAWDIERLDNEWIVKQLEEPLTAFLLDNF